MTSNHMPREVWDQITYPFPNFNGATVEVCEYISNFVLHTIIGRSYLFMLGLKLIHVNSHINGTELGTHCAFGYPTS